MCLFKIDNLKIDKKPTDKMFSNRKGRRFYHAGKQILIKNLTTLICRHEFFTGLTTDNLPVIFQRSFIREFSYTEGSLWFCLHSVTFGVIKIVLRRTRHVFGKMNSRTTHTTISFQVKIVAVIAQMRFPSFTRSSESSTRLCYDKTVKCDAEKRRVRNMPPKHLK